MTIPEFASAMYTKPDSADPLYQGDVIDLCPLIFWEYSEAAGEPSREAKQLDVRGIVLTQSCDLENKKSTRIQVAVVHETKRLVEDGILKASAIRDNVRLHRVMGWYFLEQSALLPESIVDFRDIHTISRPLIEDLVRNGQRVCTLTSPYREHLAKHFADTFSRIALPSPPKTVD